MRNRRKIELEQLERKVLPFQATTHIHVPDQGWIHTIRSAFNMTLDQLGAKLQMTKQGVKRIEISEAKETITLHSLKQVGEAMGLKLVYGFVPVDGSLDNLITKKAENLARKIVLRTNQNMELENQGIGKEKIEKSIKELTEELKREMRKSLWD